MFGGRGRLNVWWERKAECLVGEEGWERKAELESRFGI